MLKDSPIVVLDEATAFADPENEAFIQESISRLVKDKTLVVIAHRLSTIVRADRIVVMDGAACPPWARTRNCCKPRLCTGDSGNRIPGHAMPKERNMIETIRRLLDFQAVAARIWLCAFGYGVLYSVSEVIPVLAIVVALEAVLSPSGGAGSPLPRRAAYGPERRRENRIRKEGHGTPYARQLRYVRGQAH